MNRQPNIYHAYRVWRSFFVGTPNMWGETYKKPFAIFLGGYTGSLNVLSSWSLTDEGMRKLDLLLGPNAHTLVKAYFAIHPELEKPPLL